MSAQATVTKLKTEADLAQPLVGNLAWLLATTSHALATEMTAALEDIGLSPRAHCVLSTALTGDLTQTEIAQTVGLDKTTMVVLLDELEELGLAERRPSPHDRRARVVGVTPAGEQKVADGQELVEQTQAEILSSLPARERKALLDALAHLVEHRLSVPAACERTVRRRPARS
jgi:DNA-binding MarR family transcriptional regulator